MAIALAVGWAASAPAAAAPGQASGHEMTYDTGPPRTISGDSCNWPEGPAYPGGSTITLTVTTSFAGAGRTSEPVVLADGVAPPTDAPGAWSSVLPPSQLAEPPAWATEVVLRAEAHCTFAIGGGFDYEPLEVRRAVVRPDRPPTTTVPASPTTATPATAVSGSATFTG